MLTLTLNVGSSSVKFQVIDTGKKTWLYKGKIDFLKEKFEAYTTKKCITSTIRNKGISDAIELILEIMNTEKVLGKNKLGAVSHRVVHGGEKYTEPTIINKKLIQELEKISELAPLHNPFNLEGVRAAQKMLPGFPHVAVFDTGFYKTLPEKAWRYSVPVEWYKKFGIRKYGFHGISHEYVTEQTLKKLNGAKQKKIVTCHLGNGCSITASINGKAVETSMGFTPLQGVTMSTRSGDIDPAVVPYLAKKLKCNAEEVIKKLNKESGLKAISGISEDMRTIYKKAKKGHKPSQLAIEIFCYQIIKYIGAYQTAMKGLDAITFTGGIGENAPYIRKEISRYFRQTKIFVIPTNEELKMALLTSKLLSHNP